MTMTMTATEAWEALTTIRAQIPTSAAMLSAVRGDFDLYSRLIVLVKTARDGGTYGDYNALIAAIGGRYNSGTGRHEYDNDFHVHSIAYSTFYSVIFGADPVILDANELKALIARKAELEALFEKRNTTNQVDAQYGRRSWGTYHKTTGERVSSGHDREGSLGT